MHLRFVTALRKVKQHQDLDFSATKATTPLRQSHFPPQSHSFNDFKLVK